MNKIDSISAEFELYHVSLIVVLIRLRLRHEKCSCYDLTLSYWQGLILFVFSVKFCEICVRLLMYDTINLVIPGGLIKKFFSDKIIFFQISVEETDVYISRKMVQYTSVFPIYFIR